MASAKPKPAKALRFEQLVAKVHQAEDTLEEKERVVGGALRQLSNTWREAWTPARIVIAGLVAGFAVGRAEPLRAIGKSGNLMQLVSMVSSLFAGGSAQVAAEEATQAREQVEESDAVAATAPASPTFATAATRTAADDEALALAQAEARLRAARSSTVDQVES